MITSDSIRERLIGTSIVSVADIDDHNQGISILLSNGDLLLVVSSDVELRIIEGAVDQKDVVTDG